MRKTSLVCALTLILALGYLPAFGQEKAQKAQEPAPAQEATAPSVGTPAAAKTVTAIEVKGNKNINTNVVVSKMKTKVGSPYLENVISDDLKRLYLLGFFSDIKIDTEDYQGGFKVVITVAERPIIEKITFSGMNRITTKDEKLKEMLKSKESQYLDYPTLSEDTKILKKLYEKRGLSEAKIDPQVNVNPDTNKATVNFSVVEGKRIRIKNILIEGNKSIPGRRILKIIKTRRAWLFNAGVLKDEVLKEDLERVKSFYRREGFTDVTAESQVQRDEKKPFLYVTIRVNEGKKYLVGNISIEGNRDIAREEILKKLTACVPGKVFSQEALKDDVANIQGLYFDRGYIFAQAQEANVLNPQTGRIDISYSITENQVAYVDKIKIKGNIKTKDVVIRRELRIKPQDRFDGEKLRRSKERLQNLGFFEEVSYDTEESDSKEPNKRDLVVDVKEAKTGAFSFGGGYSTVDQFIGFVEVEQKNFDWRNWPYFTGAGQDLKLRASFGTLTQDFDLSFTEPWVFDYPVSFGFDGYRRTRDREEDVGYGYDQRITGGDLRLGRELTDYLRTDLTYRLDRIEITNISEDATFDLKREEGKNNISSIEPSLTFDSRDNVFIPTKGNLITSSWQYAGGPLAGDKDFWKFYARASHYIPLFRGSVLEFRGRVGLADPYGDSPVVPIYERFFAGGANTIRGYHERKIGPIDSVSKDPLGGESTVIGNLEYTYPIWSFLRLAAFYDTGNVWKKIDDIDFGDLKSGIGFGVRLKTPMGPVLVDYGIPLDKEPGEDKKGGGQFHFSMSHGF